jgi:uncharacterized protein (TIGR02145 family)
VPGEKSTSRLRNPAGVLAVVALLAFSCVNLQNPSSAAQPYSIAAPTISSVVAGSDSVTISWEPVSQALSYNLFYSQGCTVTSRDTRIADAVSPHIVANLTNGIKYAFAVSSVVGKNESVLSALRTATPLPPLPGPPSISVIGGDKFVILFWPPVPGGSTYNLYLTAGPFVTQATGMKTPGITSPDTIFGLTDWTQFAFAVTAVNLRGESALSAVVTAVPKPIPATPLIVSAIGSDRTAVITWETGNILDSITLFWSQGSMAATTTANKIANAKSPDTIGNLSNGNIYSFAVTASNGVGTSALSSVVTALPILVKDIDGNTYRTVMMGKNAWLVENLRTTRLSDGVAIAQVDDSTAWSSLTSAGYCFYHNDTTKKDAYGVLYNWYTVNTGKLAPSGWHVPADSEWAELSTIVSAGRGTTNSIGFSSQPGGFRYNDGPFSYFGTEGYWWSTTAYDTTYSWAWNVYHDHGYINHYASFRQNGFSVRLVRD